MRANYVHILYIILNTIALYFEEIANFI
jgi:hypothetical protein